MSHTRERFERDGALRLSGLIGQTRHEWETAARPFFDLGKAGHRISRSSNLAALAMDATQSPQFMAAVGTGWRCVRAIAFNKSPRTNWGLGWHQDRTIAVARRENVAGFDIWSRKDGMAHVEPPFAILERMVTLRVHLDPVDEDNAPLLVAKASHRLGKTAEKQIQTVVDRSDVMSCHAAIGDGWLYATPILHASSRSISARERRVIQIDYSRDALPEPLQWAGIG